MPRDARDDKAPLGTLDIGFAEEKPALAFQLVDTERRSGERPELGLELRRAARPPAGTDVFTPLRVPGEVRARLTDVGPRLLSRTRATLDLHFVRGVHELPLGQGDPVLLDIPPETNAKVTVEVRRRDDGEGGRTPVLQRVDMRFARPVVLRNVIHALAEVGTLFEDRTFGALFRSAPVQAAWQRMQRVIPNRVRELGERLSEPDQIGVVLLERVQARPRWRRRTKTWELRVSFGGRVRMAGGVTRPFHDIELPNVILPTPHAALEKLLTDQPLASAAVAPGRIPGLRFLRAMLASIDTASGELMSIVDLPQIAVETGMVDGTEVRARIRPSATLRVTGPFTAELTPDRTVVRLDGLELGLPQSGPRVDAVATIDHDLSDGAGAWKDRLAVGVELSVGSETTIPELGVELEVTHPLCVGRTHIPLVLADLGLAGAGSLSFVRGALALWPTTSAIRFSGALRTDGPARDDRWRGGARFAVPEASLDGSAELDTSGRWRLRFTSEARFLHELWQDVDALPELDIDEGVLQGAIEGSARLDGALTLSVPQINAPVFDLRGTSADVSLSRFELALGDRRLTLPAGLGVHVDVQKGRLTPVGPGAMRFGVSWDFGDGLGLLHRGERAVSLFAEGLRKSRLEVVLEEGGRLRLDGPAAGLYGARYFSALVNPADNPGHVLDILRSEEAIRHVIQALDLFSPELADVVADFRMLALELRTLFSRERIEEPRDVLPAHMLTRLSSLLLCGTDRLIPRLTPVIKQVTDGRGLNVREMKAILQEELDDLGYDYEIDRVARLLNLLLAPTAPVTPPPVREELPLALEPRYAECRAGIPSAAEIYAAFEDKAVTPEFAARLAGLAPHLTRAQLAWIWRRKSARWGRETLLRLRYAYELKRRVARVAATYGGLEYAPQAPWTTVFLGEAVERARDGAQAFDALGPEEVAALLQAGISAGRQGRQVQINNRLLMDLMEERPNDFTLAVFVELGHRSPRALAGAIFAFLDQDQDQMRRPKDLVSFLERKLGLSVPRQSEYLAGGLQARHLYTEAIDELCQQILARAGGYLSRKQHIQNVRHTPRPAPSWHEPGLAARAKRVQGAIAEADRLGRACTFEGRGAGSAAEARRRTEAGAAYQAAFDECAELLAQEPLAFRADWFRDFWARNEEALRVRSVVRGYQEDLDKDRRWLHVRRGNDQMLEREQPLVRAVIDELYAFQKDREELRRDPLIRLLLDPPEGHYDFTIVAAMGVITKGAEGRELENAFRRLRERRGVKVVRADTGLSRALEYNADRVIDAVRECKTPWGWVGYSQGCANALLAESALNAGTPDERRLLDQFVTRNLLFSASNGSVHGTAGDRKLTDAIHFMERFFKPYQATLSRPAIRSCMRAFKATLDSRPFVHAMGGWHSLTLERGDTLHRDLQAVEEAISSTMIGLTEEPWIPEALEMMFYVLTTQFPQHPGHDTQVTLTDARAQSTRVRNDWTRALAAADPGSRVQAIHHWSPLLADVELVLTERDRERAIYESPKDRHITPWIELNARFGRIAVKEG